MKNSSKVLFKERDFLVYQKSGRISAVIGGESVKSSSGEDEFVKFDKFPCGLRFKLKNGKYVGIPFSTKRIFKLLNGNDEFSQIFLFPAVQFSEEGGPIRELSVCNLNLKNKKQ